MAFAAIWCSTSKMHTGNPWSRPASVMLNAAQGSREMRATLKERKRGVGELTRHLHVCIFHSSAWKGRGKVPVLLDSSVVVFEPCQLIRVSSLVCLPCACAYEQQLQGYQGAHKRYTHAVRDGTNADIAQNSFSGKPINRAVPMQRCFRCPTSFVFCKIMEKKSRSTRARNGDTWW